MVNLVLAIGSIIAGIAILVILFWILIIGIAIFAFVFWILMLVDCIQRKYKQENDKIIWVLVIIFTGIIGALIYYFIVKKKDKEIKH